MEPGEEMYHSVETLWNDFLQKNPQNLIREIPPSFYFCDNEKDADECCELVVKAIKQATATSLWWYERNKETLPEVGDQYVVTDWHGNARAIIETTKVVPTPFREISPEFARTEGEGDKSLNYWRKVHRAYYTRQMEPHGERFHEDMIIICEFFRTIFRKDEGW